METPYEERPLSQVLSRIVENVQELIRSEILLLKAEFSEEAVKAGKSLAMLAIGIIIALFALGFILLAAVYVLSLVLAPWLAALLVGIFVGGIAAILTGRGMERLKTIHPKPEKTIRTVKENMQWARGQIR